MIDERHDSTHGPFDANVTHKSAGVDARDDRNPILCQVVVQRFRRAPVTWQRRQPLHDECFQERLAGFDVFRVDAGVADQRICHCDNLTGVGRVCQDLLITCHRGIENNFADSFTLETVAVAAKDTPVFKQQRRAFFHLLNVGALLLAAPSRACASRGQPYLVHRCAAFLNGLGRSPHINPKIPFCQSANI